MYNDSKHAYKMLEFSRTNLYVSLKCHETIRKFTNTYYVRQVFKFVFAM